MMISEFRLVEGRGSLNFLFADHTSSNPGAWLHRLHAHYNFRVDDRPKERAMSVRPFAGTVALITGGSSGIGRATALSFAREGAKVVIASRRAEQGEAVRHELEALGAEAEFIPTDASQSSQVELLMARMIARFGRLDYALNNAAAIDIGVFKPSADFSEEEFDKHIASNLKSVWLCMKHEISQMLHQGGGGAIVNTSSVNGLGGWLKTPCTPPPKRVCLGSRSRRPKSTRDKEFASTRWWLAALTLPY